MKQVADQIVAYGRRKLAEEIGVSYQAVCHWCTGIRKPQPRYLSEIERLTGIPRTELRPDLYE